MNYRKFLLIFDEKKERIRKLAESVTFKEKLQIQHARASQFKKHHSHSNSLSQADQAQTQMQFLKEYDPTDKIIQQNQEDIDQIEKLVQNIGDLYVEAQEGVVVAGENIEIIVSNVESAKNNVHSVTNELGKAQEYQKDEQSGYLKLCLLIAFILAMFILMFYMIY